MKFITKSLIALFIGCVLTSCKTSKEMTKEELILIESGIATTPFRILKITNPLDYTILRKKCTDVDFKKDKNILPLLIERMKATLEEANGVGLAAPQIGLTKNIFLFVRVDKPDMPTEVAINPRIVKYPKQTICFENDGCLSIPNLSGNSTRYPWIEVEYYNEHGELIKERLEGHRRGENFVAIIFQHEFDHLQGVLFTDKLCD